MNFHNQFDNIPPSEPVDPDKEYWCCEQYKCKGFTKLMKLVLQALFSFSCSKEFIKEFNEEFNEELNKGQNTINSKNEVGYTALLLASNNRQRISEVIMKRLIKAKADVNVEGGFKKSPLIFASHNSENTVKMLIDSKADVNAYDGYKMTALMYASKYSGTASTENTIKLLIKAKSDVNAKCNGKWTALMFASKYSVYSTDNTINLLMEAKADVNATDMDGYSALMLAAKYSYTTECGNPISKETTVKILLKVGANISFDGTDIYALKVILKVQQQIMSEEKQQSELLDKFINQGEPWAQIIISYL